MITEQNRKIFSLFFVLSVFICIFAYDIAASRHQMASVPCKPPIIINIKTITTEEEKRYITY